MVCASDRQTMRSLAQQVTNLVWGRAGEMGKGEAWGIFVESLPNDHTLTQLAVECFKVMSDVEKRKFLADIERRR